MSSPETAFEAGMQSVVVAALLFAVGFIITGFFSERLGLSATSRLALAVPGLMALVLLVSVIHIATGGDVLSRPGWVVTGTGVLAAAIAALTWRKGSRGRGWWRDPYAGLGLAIAGLALAIWCLPVFTSLPVSFHGDVKRHMAWAAQLSAGHSTTTGVITGEIPNYYPWLFHALASFISSFSPGGRVLHSLGPLQLLAVAGNALALFALGRELFGSRVGAAASALLGAAAGGFGFLLTQVPTLVLDPRVDVEVARFNGDFMFNRSYNLAFHNLAPPFPRDFGFLLLVSVVLLLTIGVKQRRIACFIAAGCTLGLIGLTTGESFLVGMLFAAILVAIGPGIGRLQAGAAVFGPALLVYAVWLAPVVLNYARLGGFADTSGEPVELSVTMILFSWGIAVLLALVGIVTWRWWEVLEVRPIVALVGASTVMVAAAGWVPRIDEGFTTLGRHHRYWPFVSMAVALVGARGAVVLWRRSTAAGNVVAIVATSLVVGAAVASPILASIAVTQQPVENADLADALRGETSNVLEKVAPAHGAACVIAVPKELSRSAPAYTGARLVYFPGTTRNQAGIRWPRLPDAIPDDIRLGDHKTLTNGKATAGEWHKAIDRYGVDRVVVSGTAAPEGGADHRVTAARGAHGPYVLIEIGSC